MIADLVGDGGFELHFPFLLNNFTFKNVILPSELYKHGIGQSTVFAHQGGKQGSICGQKKAETVYRFSFGTLSKT